MYNNQSGNLLFYHYMRFYDEQLEKLQMSDSFMVWGVEVQLDLTKKFKIITTYCIFSN